MVIYVNGLPIFTFELKNPYTHQTAHYDGQKQYKSADRDPKETLLKYGHCLAHFTLDKDEVFFTTKLDLSKTFFMPFNKGQENGQGAGNPINDEGYKTSYLWDEVLRKNSVAEIIMNYVLFDYDESKTQKRVPHIMKNAKRLIFPRYHQLDAVNKLVADVEKVGVGKTYLIQHSAGSGKSNSITWLAYKLISTYPCSMNAARAKALDMPLFNSAIVVTDRRLLDKQITDNIKAFSLSDKIIAHVSTSNELKDAIENNKRIITTTIQKFPYICDAIGNVSDRNFAIIIDEAHSSQSGVTADKLNATLQKDADTDSVDTDELLKKIMRDRKMSTNCSYFAFTATPKNETLERFGVKDTEGKFHPFHLYSMKQAIEEGFILDVLPNYTTYNSYYELIKSVQDNPEYNNEKAQKLLRKAVERDPKTIENKAKEMLWHFYTQIVGQHRLKGKAKAMVVTQDIGCAIEYYRAICKISKEKKYPFKTLIAFSTKENSNGETNTESDMNGFPEGKTAEMFETDEYRILVVANKYLTGFDQPKLCAMYIDKPLSGVLAVQALSRLNRSAPSLDKRSKDLFILDFYNSLDEIKASFDPYYTSITLAMATDPNILHTLKTTLLGYGVYDNEDVNKFIEYRFHGAKAYEWEPIIDKVAERFNTEIEWEDNNKADFKVKCKQFVNVYSKIAAIISYENIEWEKLYLFLGVLIPNLKIDGEPDDDEKNLLDCVDLNTYGLKMKESKNIGLDNEDSEVDPHNVGMAGAGGDEDDNKDSLDKIIEDFNNKWFKGWDATPEEQKEKLNSIAKAVKNNERYKNQVVDNPDKQIVEMVMDDIIKKEIRNKRISEQSLYKEYAYNETFKEGFNKAITRLLNSNILKP